MARKAIQAARLGFIFLLLHTLIIAILKTLRMGPSGYFFDRVAHFLDYPLAESLHSHEVQRKILFPVAEWLEAHFPTPLLAETLVFMAFGGVFYFIIGCLAATIITRYRTHHSARESEPDA